MKLDAPKNKNYAAVVVRVNTIVELGLDNLVGIPALGHQALTTRDDVEVGDLRIAFTAETQLSEEYAKFNNLYRDETLNSLPAEKGYLEKNARVRAIKLAGHRSDALLMPLESVQYCCNPGDLQEGDTFDTLDGHEICRKYEVPVKQVQGQAKSKVEKAFKRVDKTVFPEHLDTDNFWRSLPALRPYDQIVVTQKLHGTSLRVGNVPVLRQKGRLEKFLNRWLPTADHECDVVYGSRKVIKDVNNPNQNHFYTEDIWTEYGSKIAELIPEGYILYAELIGWTPTSAAIQKNYTYHLPQGDAELFVYRVAHINRHGHLSDLAWDGVKDFCRARGLKWTPELFRIDFSDPNSPWVENPEDEYTRDDLATDITALMDYRYADHFHDNYIFGEHFYFPFVEEPLSLSDPKTVDEGICLRQDGLVPLILKAKSPKFLAHETKLLDKGEADLESAA